MEVFDELTEDLISVIGAMKEEIVRQRALRLAEDSAESRHDRSLFEIIDEKNATIDKLRRYIDSIRKSVSNDSMEDT
jgi:hypothetical protein